MRYFLRKSPTPLSRRKCERIAYESKDLVAFLFHYDIDTFFVNIAFLFSPLLITNNQLYAFCCILC